MVWGHTKFIPSSLLLLADLLLQEDQKLPENKLEQLLASQKSKIFLPNSLGEEKNLTIIFRKEEKAPAEEYPTTRGLVSRQQRFA